jgi:hypothetical protein
MDRPPFGGVWQAADAGKLSLLSHGQGGAEPRFATEFRCLWDDDCLYVAFNCAADDVWATLTQRDEALWNEPVVEVFLDPLGEGKSFFEFQTNPLGAIYDSYVSDASQSDDWRKWRQWNCAGLKTVVFVDGGLSTPYCGSGWSALFTVPLASLEEACGRRPEAGAVWRANFARYDYRRECPRPELTCWAPVVDRFDDLGRFGSITFI